METDSVVELISTLIAMPSVNPRLAPPGDLSVGEGRLTEWLGRYATRAGWRWALQAVHPGRSNFLALVPGGRGDVLLLEAHQDTVSGEGMSIEPFRADVRDGRVYGRGACDVKGGMAAMLAALTRVAAEPPQGRPCVLMACTVNEECGFSGAVALADMWRCSPTAAPPASCELGDAPKPTIFPAGPLLQGEGSLTLDELRQLRPTAAIIAEPTDLNVVVAHRGVARWQATVHGRAAHSSRPEQGANAIYAMARVTSLIEEFHRVELKARPADPMCGPPAACVTTIRGGSGPNTVPDRAVIDIDRRLRPDETPEEAYRELTTYLSARAELAGCRLEHEPPWMQSRGLAAGANRRLAAQLVELGRSTGLSSQAIGVPYGTNAASIAAAGIPAVIFGPGSIAQAHTSDEWVAIEELERSVDVLYRVACGGVRLQSAGGRREA
jgi:acetylornithine deacetylase